MSLSYGSRKGNKIEWIVVHYPVAPGCDASWCKSYYERDKVSESAHYAVSSNETVSIVPCSFAAFHCATKGKDKSGNPIKTYCAANNYNSIGIDLMDNKLSRKTLSVKDTDWFITESALDRASYLIAYLMKQYNIPIEHVVRHYDVTLKNCPRPLVGDDINTYYGISGNQKWKEFKQLIQERLK